MTSVFLLVILTRVYIAVFQSLGTQLLLNYQLPVAIANTTLKLLKHFVKT